MAKIKNDPTSLTLLKSLSSIDVYPIDKEFRQKPKIFNILNNCEKFK